MSETLVKLACSVNEKDIYLNCNPEITFFKKKYKKYTKFSKELKQIKFNNTQEYNSNISFEIKNQGDLLHRCFVEINIPEIEFTDDVINDSSGSLYYLYKNSKLSDINNKINNWKSLYDNMYNFSSIEIVYYKELTELLTSDNVTIEMLSDKVEELNSSTISENVKEHNYSNDLIDESTGLSVDSIINSVDVDTWEKIDDSDIKNLWSSFSANEASVYSTNRDIYKDLIDADVFSQVDIVGYIESLVNESISEIKTTLENKYNIILKYLNYYYSNLTYFENKYDDENNVKIKYAWSEKLGHYYFNNYEIEFNGNKIDSYDSDQLDVFQSYHVNRNNRDNYNEMIGNVSELYEFSNKTRSSRRLYVPLIFWFCRDSQNSLPLVVSKNTIPKLNLKFNDLKNLLYFIDWESEYDNLLTLDISLDDHDKNSNGSVKLISGLEYDSVEIIYPEYIYRYKCNSMNKTFLELKYPNIDVDSVLEYYGTLLSEVKILTKNDYVHMMNNIKEDIYLSENDRIELAGYHYFIDYNYFYNKIDKPDIKLFGEFIYLDELEKRKFCDSKLEYLIELFNKEEYEINDTEYFTHEIDKDILIKNIFWFCRPKNIINGLSDNNKIYNNTFNKSNFYNSEIIDNIEFIFNSYNLLKQNNVSNFYDNLKPYIFLKDKLSYGINFINLSLYPHNSQPSGSFNLSQIKNKVVRINLNKNFLAEYFDNIFNEKSLNPKNTNIEFKLMMTNYNVLVIDNFESKLIFYHK